MTEPFRPGPATARQLEILRELAASELLPQPQAKEHAGKRIAAGLDVNEAYALIGEYGRRIRAEAQNRQVTA